MSGILNIKDSEFEAEVMNSEVPVLVDFWAPWCGPCKGIAPILEDLSKEYDGRLKIVKVNIDDNREAASKFNVRSIPNLIIFKNGQHQEQVVGFVAKQELIRVIDKVLV